MPSSSKVMKVFVVSHREDFFSQCIEFIRFFARRGTREILLFISSPEFSFLPPRRNMKKVGKSVFFNSINFRWMIKNHASISRVVLASSRSGVAISPSTYRRQPWTLRWERVLGKLGLVEISRNVYKISGLKSFLGYKQFEPENNW